MNVKQFKAQPHIVNFDINYYTVQCLFTFKDISALLKEEWRSKRDLIINDVDYNSFDERHLKDYSFDEIFIFIKTLLDFDDTDIGIYSNAIIINNFTKYQSNLDDYKVEYLDLAEDIFLISI